MRRIISMWLRHRSRTTPPAAGWWSRRRAGRTCTRLCVPISARPVCHSPSRSPSTDDRSFFRPTCVAAQWDICLGAAMKHRARRCSLAQESGQLDRLICKGARGGTIFFFLHFFFCSPFFFECCHHQDFKISPETSSPPSPARSAFAWRGSPGALQHVRRTAVYPRWRQI